VTSLSRTTRTPCPSIRATAPLGPLGLLLAAVALGLQILLGAPQPLLALAGPEPALSHGSGAPACAPISTQQVADLFNRWNDALASGDPEQVAALYSDDALLLPTLSAEPRQSHAAIRDYFTDFLARAPQGRIDSRTIQLGCNSAVDAGTYSFLVADPGPAEGTGERHWVSARYTFLYGYRDGEWRILHHHSSLQPPA